VSKVACALGNLLFPSDCRICGELLRDFSRIPVCPLCLAPPQPIAAEYFCVSCRMTFLTPHPLDESGRCTLCRLGAHGFDAAYSYASYGGTLRKLVHLYKYSGVHPLSKVFGQWMALALPREQTFDMVVPMPIHWWKRVQRGFNQAEFLAGEIARRWNVPVRKAVRRTRSTPSQSGLTNAKRRANVQGSFAMARGMRLDGKRILLIDDVLTTGATASACARVLKRAGAKHVTILTLARTDRRLAPYEFPERAATAAGSGS